MNIILVSGESCIEKPLATLWRNYQQSTKPDVLMKLSVTNSGLKGFTKEHGLTEYWSHRITYCASPPHYPKLFCWVYRHEGKKLKHELRCHAVLCTKESLSKKITEELQVKLKQALVEFKKDRISKQNARLSLANSVYENPTMPRRKILLSVGAMNYRPPLERSKSAPKLGAIEELCSEEDEEEAEMKARENLCSNWARTSFNMDDFSAQTLDRRRPDVKSPRKLSCPESVMNSTLSNSGSGAVTISDELLDLIAKERNRDSDELNQNTDEKLESIAETNELTDAAVNDGECKLTSNYLVTDSDDGSVSSGCETASTAASDTEPSSLPSLPQEEQKRSNETDDLKQTYEHTVLGMNYSNITQDTDEVNHVPIGEKNGFRRRSTYPPLNASTISSFDEKFESLLDNLTDSESIHSSTDTDVFKNGGDNDSACSDESGYSELLEGKESIIGNTIMV